MSSLASLKVNKGTGRVQEGDIVSAESHVVCHVCRMCRRNMYHACENTRIIGVHMDGAFAEYIAIPEENLVKLPGSVPWKLVRSWNPLAMRSIRCNLWMLEAKGCGYGSWPIGVMAIPVAKALGAVEIIATDLSDYRLKLASDVEQMWLLMLRNKIRPDCAGPGRRRCGFRNEW